MGKIAKGIGYAILGWIVSLFFTGFNIGFLGAINGWSDEEIHDLAKILYTRNDLEA